MTKIDTLKNYKHRVWDEIENFDAFNLIVVPRKLNQHADRLASIGALFDIAGNISK